MSKILYIDAGHGSLDANGNYTTPPKNGKWFDHKKGQFHKGSIFYEGVFNRSLAEKFMYLATQAGFHCVPVYDPIQDTALGKRVETANNYSKDVAGGKGIYLSFHSNAANSKARGFNLFYHPKSSRGKKLATELVTDIQSVFVKHGSKSTLPLREGYMNGKWTAIYYVLEATAMPSLLFEFGFFDNFEDATLLFSEEFQCELAQELVNSLSKATLY
jgi:N-acetylmuramoyl-L-alanine amidase